MTFKEILMNKNMTLYALSKATEIPYSTLMDVVSGKKSLENCSAKYVKRIAEALAVPSDMLLDIVCNEISFDGFRSNVQHKLKRLNDLEFINDVVYRKEIDIYYNLGCYSKSLYLLATIDYLCRVNEYTVPCQYDILRCKKLKHPIYPNSVTAFCLITNDYSLQNEAMEQSIEEFKRFNIAEGDIRNVE